MVLLLLQWSILCFYAHTVYMHTQITKNYFVRCYNQFQDVPRVSGQDSHCCARYEICIVLRRKNNNTLTTRSLLFLWADVAHSQQKNIEK